MPGRSNSCQVENAFTFVSSYTVDSPRAFVGRSDFDLGLSQMATHGIPPCEFFAACYAFPHAKEDQAMPTNDLIPSLIYKLNENQLAIAAAVEDLSV
jgi:hypothetical protein